MLDTLALIQHCAPTVDPQTMSALVKVESNNHPYTIGVVGGRLIRQPASHREAVATAHQLEKDGWNFSVGLGQINCKYLSRHEITYDQAFKPCINLQHSSKILKDCYLRAQKCTAKPQAALRAALSCYYAGNFWRCFKSESQNKPSYVQKVVTYADKTVQAIPVVPAIQRENHSNALSSADTNLKDLNMKNSIPTQMTKNPLDHAPVLLSSSKTDNATVVQSSSLVTDTGKEEKQDKNTLTVEQPHNTLVF